MVARAPASPCAAKRKVPRAAAVASAFPSCATRWRRPVVCGAAAAHVEADDEGRSAAAKLLLHLARHRRAVRASDQPRRCLTHPRTRARAVAWRAHWGCAGSTSSSSPSSMSTQTTRNGTRVLPSLASSLRFPALSDTRLAMCRRRSAHGRMHRCRRALLCHIRRRLLGRVRQASLGGGTVSPNRRRRQESIGERTALSSQRPRLVLEPAYVAAADHLFPHAISSPSLCTRVCAPQRSRAR